MSAFNSCKDYTLPQGVMIKMKEFGEGVILLWWHIYATTCLIILTTYKFFKSICKIIVGLSGKESINTSSLIYFCTCI